MTMSRTSGNAWRPEKVVSGGQTGVDRAALDVALEASIECGGWCPKGRRAENGCIPEKYPLQESPTENYAERTALNVKESDGTLILCCGPLRGGSALTKTFAERYRRPYLIVDLHGADTTSVREWLQTNAIRVLNIAGPRESSKPGIAQKTATFLRALFGVADATDAADRRKSRRAHASVTRSK